MLVVEIIGVVLRLGLYKAAGGYLIVCIIQRKSHLIAAFGHFDDHAAVIARPSAAVEAEVGLVLRVADHALKPCGRGDLIFAASACGKAQAHSKREQQVQYLRVFHHFPP